VAQGPPEPNPKSAEGRNFLMPRGANTAAQQIVIVPCRWAKGPEP
jgi:hypothetical protein